MLKALLSILNVVEGEERPVLLMLGYGFFMGVFLAVYKIVATTLFLNQMSEYIREAFFVSGFLGVLSTWIYAIIQNRVQYSRLVIFNIISIFIFIAVSWSIYTIDPSEWLVFTMFVMLGPITSLLILGFWGIFGRLFDLRQSKRIIGGIDSGQLTAIIITTFTIPFIIPYIAKITNILLVGEFGLVISLVFFFVLIAKFPLSSFHNKDKNIKRETKFSVMFKNKYILYLSVFLFLSMAAFVFVDYSFMNVTEKQYPDERQLASFLGVFEGSIMVLGLMIQTFINERLLTMYGMKTSLLILPFILVVFTGLAISAGYLFGFDVANSNFIWFFLFIALSRLFVSTLRDATESPVFKLFFMPLDSRIRFDIQTKIEGTVNELSRFLSGGLILLLGFLPFFKLLDYSWILVAIIIGWVYMIFKIYHLYKVNIQLKLERQKEEADRVEQKGKSLLITKIYEAIDSGRANLVIFAFRTLSKIAPDTFKDKVMQLNGDKNSKIVQSLEQDYSFIHIANLKKSKSNRIKRKLDDNSQKLSVDFETELSSMIKSKNKNDRKFAAELISASNVDESIAFLIELLNDKEKEVRKAAMNAAAELKKKELLPFIFENLKDEELKESASEALLNFGEDCFKKLENIFYSSDQEIEIKIEIVGLYGKIGGEDAENLLWEKINYPDRNVVNSVLLALSHCGFNTSNDQVQQIKFYLEEDIKNIVSNLKAIEQIKAIDKDEFLEVIQSLEEENKHYYNHLYMLLSMIYDQKSIQLVKENIATNTNEGISYAIELLDVFLSEDLKQKIIPILDDTNDLDRIRRLQVYYPDLKISDDDLIKYLLNREFTSVNRWTKASILNIIGIQKLEGKFDLELIANLFNPDLLLSEVSAWAMHEIKDSFYMENAARLESPHQQHLNNLLLGLKYEHDSSLRPHFLFEKVKFLKNESILGGLPFYILARLVDFSEEVYLEDKTIIQQNDWKNDCFYIIVHGSLEIIDQNNEVTDQFEKGDFVGEQINIDLLDTNLYLRINSDSLMYRIDKNKFLDLITDEYEVTIELLNSFENENNLETLMVN